MLFQLGYASLRFVSRLNLHIKNLIKDSYAENIDHDQRREEIAQQVNTLISEKGIENTTVRAICRRCRI